MDDNKPKGGDGIQIGETPELVGTVLVALSKGGKVGIQSTGGISKLTMLGLLAAGQSIILNTGVKEKTMITPSPGIPDELLKRPPKGA